MTVQEQQGNQVREIKVADVAEYLIKHPDFFEKHPDVLKQLEVPHGAKGTISLIERQVGVLRQENRNLRGRIRELVDIAKENDQLASRMNQLSAEIVKSQSLSKCMRVMKERLLHDFTADAVSIRLIGSFNGHPVNSTPEFVIETHEALPLFETILARAKPVCGRFNLQQLEFMFGSDGDKIKSAAVIPLGENCLGFLVIGSVDPERFRAGISTSFLSYLGEIAGAVVQRFR
ncbi:MAG: DUF484 family protein [Gammaproteobacteria bacterium]|nr:DUF484 family protein [Gammaproteobacteria bacterium]